MKLIILTYVDRSGSTFLANQISRCPSVFVFPEAGGLSRYLLENPLQKFKGNKFLEKRLLIKTKQNYQLQQWPLKELINRSWDIATKNIDVFIEMLKLYAAKLGSKADIWMFKQPNLFSLHENKGYLNKQPFKLEHICLLRDPRAVFNSQYSASKLFPTLSFYKNPLISAHTWLYFYKKAKIYSKDTNFHLVYYEKLLLDLPGQLKELGKFLGIETPSFKVIGKGKLFNLLSDIEKILHQKIDDNPDGSRSNAWEIELKPAVIKLIEQHTFERMPIAEYERFNPTINSFLVELLKLYYKIRIKLLIDKY